MMCWWCLKADMLKFDWFKKKFGGVKGTTAILKKGFNQASRSHWEGVGGPPQRSSWKLSGSKPPQTRGLVGLGKTAANWRREGGRRPHPRGDEGSAHPRAIGRTIARPICWLMGWLNCRPLGQLLDGPLL